jgi:hypothetical protein
MEALAVAPPDCGSICWQLCLANGNNSWWTNDTIVWMNLPAA